MATEDYRIGELLISDPVIQVEDSASENIYRDLDDVDTWGDR